MIGVVMFGHGKLAKELARVAEMILGPQEALVPVGVEPEEGEAAINGRLNEAIKQANQGDGVLLVTDMFGGTPMNFGCRFLDAANVEVVTGVNLAMLIRALSSRKHEGLRLADLAAEAADYGRKDISVAGALLRGTAKTEGEAP